MAAQKITNHTKYCTQCATYYEWHNFIYKLESEVVYFKMEGTWNWYKSCITPIELFVSIKKGAMKKLEVIC